MSFSTKEGGHRVTAHVPVDACCPGVNIRSIPFYSQVSQNKKLQSFQDEVIREFTFKDQPTFFGGLREYKILGKSYRLLIP